MNELLIKLMPAIVPWPKIVPLLRIGPPARVHLLGARVRAAAQKADVFSRRREGAAAEVVDPGPGSLIAQIESVIERHRSIGLIEGPAAAPANMDNVGSDLSGAAEIVGSNAAAVVADGKK